MPPPPFASFSFATVRISSHDSGCSSTNVLAEQSLTPLRPPTTETSFIDFATRARATPAPADGDSVSLIATSYMHLEIFDVDAYGVPVSSVRTLYTSTTVVDDREAPTLAASTSGTHHPLSEFNARRVRVNTARAFATRTTTTATDAILTASSYSKASDMDVLPDFPKWAVGFMLGCFAFVAFVAAALFMAQFRSQMQLSTGIGRWIKGKGRGTGYRQLNQDEYELNGIYHSGRDGAQSARYGHTGALKNRKMHTKHLSINTRQQYAGLGIAVHSQRDVDSAQLQRHSEDLHSMAHSTGVKMGRRGSETAPLPGGKRFSPPLFARRPSSAYRASADVEGGRELMPRQSGSTPEIFDYHSAIHSAVPSPMQSARSTSAAVFDKINNGVASAAEKMAKRFYDHLNPMNEPEEGLWLPVRDDEREKRALNGVLVA